MIEMWVSLGSGALMGGLLGGLGVWVWLTQQHRSQWTGTQHENQRLRSQLETEALSRSFLEKQQQETVQRLQQQEEQTQQTEAQLRDNLEQARTQLAKTAEELRLSQLHFQQTQQTLEKDWLEKFDAITQRTLKMARQELEENAAKEHQQRQALFQENLGKTLKPQVEQMALLQKQIEALREKSFEQNTLLNVNLEKTYEQTQKLIEAKNHLVSALSHSKGRGDWGELELMTLLEDSGLVQGIHYEFQPTYEGGAYRPDIQINLPNDRVLFIDAKALLIPLEKMEVASHAGSSDEPQRKKLLDSLKAEIQKLSRKAYHEKNAKSPDFVILYVPRESMLRIPLEEDPALMRDAYRDRVILASPLVLMALLRTVAQGWQQADISRNAEEVQKLGKDLHERMARMVERFQKLGVGIDALSKAYSDVLTGMNGRMGVLRQLKKLEEYGCQSKKSIPEELPPVTTHCVEENASLQRVLPSKALQETASGEG